MVQEVTTPQEKAVAHTALPWTKTGDWISNGKKAIANCGTLGTNPQEGEANAAFIVRACNSHYQLLRAATYALEALRAIQKHILPQVAGQSRRFTEETNALEQAISAAEEGL